MYRDFTKFYLVVSAFIGFTPYLPLASAEPIQTIGSFSSYQTLLEENESGKKAVRATEALPEVQIARDGDSPIKLRFTENVSRTWEASFVGEDYEISDPGAVILLRGTAIVGKEETPVAGAIYRTEGRAELHANLILPSGEPVEAVIALDNPDRGELVKANPASLSQLRCGTDKLPPISTQFSVQHSTPKMQAVVAANSLRSIDIATETDYEYFQINGSNSNAKIASIINAAQTIYLRDLGLRFNIVRQRVRSTIPQPFSSIDSSDLLDQLTSTINSQGGAPGADVLHLFSGKVLLDGVAGLAWLGVICNAPSLAYSLTETVSPALDPLLFGHEVGHNLGAEHDASFPKSIMYPVAGTGQNFFSSTSKSEIASHVNAFGSCLAVVATPTSTPTPAPSGTPAPTPTNGGGGGGGGGGSNGNQGNGNATSLIGLSAAFNQKNGRIVFTVSRRSKESLSCRYTIELATKINMSDKITIQKTSTARSVQFGSGTTKRVKTSRERIYVRGHITNCGNSITSVIADFSPVKSKTTKRGDLVNTKSWVKAIRPKLKVLR